jgi:Big-like domain-containing protein
MLLRLCAASILATAGSAHAVLLDRGPQDPLLTFPLWYRDQNGLALQECLSKTPSPNPGALSLPMCFALNPDPLGFPGNVGPEVFYSNVTVKLGKAAAAGAGFSTTYLAALEGAYIPGPIPTHGQEVVFARVRILMNVVVAGTYKVAHPYGVEVFPNVQPGPRAVFFTADVPVGVPGNFDLALGGRMGPFPQWDFVDPTFTLDLTNPITRVTESFVGDPNISHTFIGSPFGTNFVRVDGPVGSNLDGLGNDFIQTPLAAVVGQKYLLPIPTPLSIKRATYSIDPARNVLSVDVWAKSAPANQMILTGVGLPSLQMKGDALGNYFGHAEMPAAGALPPASVLVTNMTSTPAASVTAGLFDLVEVPKSTYDTLTSTLTVTATSSDRSAPGPAFTLVAPAPVGGLMTAGAYTSVLPAGAVPPESVTVLSSAGGAATEDVVVLPGLPMNPPLPPVAVADVLAATENTVATLDVTLNDVLVPPATVGSVIIVSAPVNGTAAASPLGGVVTYTPNLNYFGPDSFTYVLVDSTGKYSNLATVTVNVGFIAPAPIATPDDFAMLQNTATPLKSRAYNVLANDLAQPGTVLDPASVLIATAPLHGTVTAGATGSVTYTPALKWVGTDSFTYTMRNTAGLTSAPAKVNAVTFGGPEVVSIVKAIFASARTQWNITGSTNWNGAALLNTTITCYIGKGTTGTLLGSTPVDNTGAWAFAPPSLTTPPPDATKLFTCQSSNGGSVTATVLVN